jgi:hypothetical protein
MLMHCIIDGYSRFVLGIRVHDNNLRGKSAPAASRCHCYAWLPEPHAR